MMSKDINNAKAVLLDEIKTTCEEIQKIQSFSGLVSLESRIHKMHRDFIVLKYLDENSILSDYFLEKPKDDLIKMEEKIELEVQKDIPKLALSLNDKIAFQNKLFNKNQTLFGKVIQELNNSPSLMHSKELIKAYAKQFDWASKEEYAERLEVLIEKQFD